MYKYKDLHLCDGMELVEVMEVWDEGSYRGICTGKIKLCASKI